MSLGGGKADPQTTFAEVCLRPKGDMSNSGAVMVNHSGSPAFAQAQKVAELRYDCPEAREKLGYQAQEKWLELFGTNLATELRWTQ